MALSTEGSLEIQIERFRDTGRREAKIEKGSRFPGFPPIPVDR